MTNLIIDVTDLSKSFDNKVVVNHIDIQVKKGEVFGFLGPNGSGKTTTIRMLCGLLIPDSGRGTCLGYDILRESVKIKQHIGYLTQKFSFYTDLSIEENLLFVSRIYGISDRAARIEKIISDLGLTQRRRQLMGELSGGWKQRVALAACLLHEPDLLLLDEPTAGVDPIARREFWNTIHHLSNQGVTTLMSTHYMDEAERCTRLSYIAHGDLLITGTVDEVIMQTQLKTWEITSDMTKPDAPQETQLLQYIQGLKGIIQVALFGRKIHACGYEVALIERELHALASRIPIQWYMIDTTLEDAFISLVRKHADQPLEEESN